MRQELLVNSFLNPGLEEDLPLELEISKENVMDGNPELFSLYHLDNLCYDSFKKLPSLDEEKHLFRFVRFPFDDAEIKNVKCEFIEEEENKSKCPVNKGIADGFLRLVDPKKDKVWDGSKCPIIKDIKNNSISLSSPRRFNDPVDPLIKAWVENRRIHHNGIVDKRCCELIEKTIGKIHICSLVDPLRNKRLGRNRVPNINGINPLMWAHYADSHKGLCIQYKVKPSNCEDTDNQILRLLDVQYNKKFPLNGELPLTDSFVVKAKCWSYENETRLIAYSRDNEEDFLTLGDFEVEAVYMGYRIGHQQRDYLKRMLKGSSIKLFQMSFSEKDITQLVAHEIKN